MKPPPPTAPPPARRDARLRDAAVLLPGIGLLLLMPPFIGLVSPQRTLIGVPLPVLYLFGVWAALIVGAAMLARRLEPPDRRPPEAGTAPPAPDAPPGH